MAKNIKLQGPSKKSRFNQGVFDKYASEKYFGPKPIVYRSSWELTYMRNLELNPAVSKWTSESIAIPYLMKEKKVINGQTQLVTKRRNYFPDFLVIMKTGKIYLIEVKPLSQTPLNESQIRMNPDMYRNHCKWSAALEFCKQKGYEFKIVTEKQLKIPLV